MITSQGPYKSTTLSEIIATLFTRTQHNVLERVSTQLEPRAPSTQTTHTQGPSLNTIKQATQPRQGKERMCQGRGGRKKGKR